jgi:UDP-GlcNAc:undecaprenyl-phosphate GlcNAc-1-phosphate transferase
MMSHVLHFILGALCCFVSYFFLRDFLHQPEAVKENYSGAKIPALGGIVALCALFISQAVASLVTDSGSRTGFAQAALIVTLGYAFIGLLDDLVGDKSRQGFKGHISALFKGTMTTGALKLFGGPAIAFFAFAPGIASRGYIPVIVDALCVALIANLFNLLDLAPGRTSKYMAITAVGVLVLYPERTFLYCVLGVLIVSMVFDLREKFMLGDTGANLFGALIGFYLVTTVSDETTLIILGGVFALNVLSEFVSFSKIISVVAPLRWFDYLGQTKARRAWAEDRRTHS